MRSWIRQLFAVPRKPIRRTLKTRARLALEPLEDRLAPAQYVVNNTRDDGSVGSLRWAVAQANLSGADTITFDNSVFSTAQTITLTRGELGLTDTSGATTIRGPGAGLLTVSGNDVSRVFLIY